LDIDLELLTNQDNHGEGFAYRALLCIKTPSIDDSGVAHAIEHLVFRANRGAPNPANYFQITSLLPLTINASTDVGFTYYHCSSDQPAVFLFGLEYLLNAISGLEIAAQDLSYELGDGQKGVIHQELTAQQYRIELANTSFSLEQLLSSDHRVCRLMQIDGCQDSIGDLTLAQLRRYYSAHYQPQNITLTFASAAGMPPLTKEVNELLAAIKFRFTDEVTDATTPTVAMSPIVVSQLPDAAIEEYCWWIKTTFSRYQSLCELMTAQTNKSCYLMPASEHPNPQGNWPVRLLVTGANPQLYRAQLQQTIIDFLSANANTGVLLQPTNRLPPAIASLLPISKESISEQLVGLTARKLQFELSEPAIHRTARTRAAIYTGHPHTLGRELSLLANRIAIPTRKPVPGPKGYCCITTSGAFDLELFRDKLKRSIGADFKIIDQALYLKHRNNSLDRAALAIEAFTIGDSSSQLPKVLAKLRPNVSVPSARIQRLEAQSFTLKFQLSASPIPPPGGLLYYGNTQHSIWEYQTAPCERWPAWYFSLILGAFAPFIARRTTGHCYAMACRYCRYQQRLIIFSAYDDDCDGVKAHVARSLITLTEQPEFIIQATGFARLKIESILSSTHDRVSITGQRIAPSEIIDIALALHTSLTSQDNNHHQEWNCYE